MIIPNEPVYSRQLQKMLDAGGKQAKRARKLIERHGKSQTPKKRKPKLPKRKKKKKKAKDWSQIKSRKAKYNAYLQSKRWQGKRAVVIRRDKKVCQDCQKKILFTNDMHVHHLTYERIFNEDIADLVLLCETCHKKRHKGWE